MEIRAQEMVNAMQRAKDLIVDIRRFLDSQITDGCWVDIHDCSCSTANRLWTTALDMLDEAAEALAQQVEFLSKPQASQAGKAEPEAAATAGGASSEEEDFDEVPF